MTEDSDTKQNITGDDNVQINSAGDTVAAIGEGSIAAGRDVIINHGNDKLLLEKIIENTRKEEEYKQRINQLEAELKVKNQKIESMNLKNSGKSNASIIDSQYVIKLHELGLACINVGDYEKAERYYQDSISKAKFFKDKTLLSWGFNGLSILENVRGNLQQSIEYSKHITHEDPILTASYIGNQGIIECRSGNYKAGEKLFHSALDIFKQHGFEHGIANTLNSLGNVEKHYQNYVLAEEYYKTSMEIKNRLGDELGVCNSLLNIGIIRRMTKNYNEALNAYFKCLKFAEKNDNKSFIADLNGNIGNIHLDLTDYEKAGYHYNIALNIKVGLGDEIGIGLCKQNLGSLAYEMNDLELAESLFLESKDLLQKNNSEHLKNTLLGLQSIEQRRQEKI